MKKLLAVMSLFALTTQAFSNEIRFRKDRLLVKMNSGSLLEKSGDLTEVKRLIGDIYIVRTTNLDEAISQLKNRGDVAYVEKDYYAGRKGLPNKSDLPKELRLSSKRVFNDPKTGSIWSFNDAASNGVSVYKAYENPINKEKSEIVVAVVDTGVDYNHEDLKASMWVNANEIPGNGVDDDGNGYVDDIHGIDTLERDADGNATGDPMDTHSHGTHVSGTIGATQNNSKGISGIASTVKIMAIRTVPNNGDETDIDVAESFVYAAKHGARIINCSFGKRHNEGGMAVSDVIGEIGKQFGTLVVAAAGNDYGRDIDRNLVYPASFPNKNLMVVASTTSRGRLSGFSNIGKKNVDISAPGSSIYSTVPGNRYSSMSGTSMASPTTAGVAAEVLAHFPHMDGFELKAHLMETVTKGRAYRGKMVSEGRVDLFKALND
jgi:thermitase